MNNLYFFTGENDYALSQEVSRWKKTFVTKYGEENLTVLRGSDADLSSLLDAIQTIPFIAEKRLILVEGMPKVEKDSLETIQHNFHPQVVMAVIESKPDKRLGFYKELVKKAEVKEFKKLKTSELADWLRKEAGNMGKKLRQPAVFALLSTVGEDQWNLENELKKAALFCGGEEISADDIENIAVPSGSQIVWRLTDLIGERKSNEALSFFRKRLERGEDVYGFWGILLNMVKNLGLIVAAMDAGVKGEKALAEAAGLKPFSVTGLMPLARSMDIQKVRGLVQFVTDADIHLKSGGYHYTSERPEEVIALSERVIMACA